jgi:transcriptional regulator with GAF, ATPase, and Fis domain
MLLNDLQVSPSTDSVVASGNRSDLCVPLLVKSVPVGVIYLTTTDAGTPFNETHLRLTTAIGGIAAIALEHARYVEWLENENRQMAHEMSLQHEMIGDSPKMKEVYEAISLVAPTDTPVLILGESGTGKELAARAIHNNSSRRHGPFVAVNCGAISETLFASALFGHVKGAFTGADRDHKGFIEEADGGTLFLDELGDLPLHCQAALLRVLEDQEIRRVGSGRTTRVDIRLISATNRSLKEDIQKEKFRADLYFRMGLPLEMPPLRERLEDVPALVNFFIGKHKKCTQREIGATPPNTLRVLQEYEWPGNVRELSGVIRWAVVFGKSDRIRVEDLPAEISRRQNTAAPSVRRLDEAMEAFERQFILRALEETRGNVVEAAVLLARAPNYLQRRISQLDLREDLERIRAGR